MAGVSQAFGRLLRKLREEGGLTQRQLANAVDISDAMVTHYERGRRTPSEARLERIIDVLDLSRRDADALRQARRTEGPSEQSGDAPVLEALAGLILDMREAATELRGVLDEGHRLLADLTELQHRQSEAAKRQNEGNATHGQHRR